MENLHLKNLKNIYSPKYIEDRLNNIEIPHYVINNFKETFISDLYSNNSYHLIKIGMNIIQILEVIKKFDIEKTLTSDELSKILNNNTIIRIYNYSNYYEVHIYYYKKPESKLDNDYREIAIDINHSNKIRSIYQVNPYATFSLKNIEVKETI